MGKDNIMFCAKKLGLVDMFAGSTNCANDNKQTKVDEDIQVQDLST